MRIGLIDADLIDNGTRFPNLVLMKLSSYYKSQGYNTELIDYDNIKAYDKVFISKVFSKTNIPIDMNKYNNIQYGGTGFDFDKQHFLVDEIEHSKPDYELYRQYKNNSRYYDNYSVGFTTRFCFRQCQFCVNRDKTQAVKWSPIKEFDDDKNDKIVLLDDNVLAYRNRMKILNKLIKNRKPFEFKQGLDFRLLNDEIIDILATNKLCNEHTFAFDNIEDRDKIERNLKKWRAKYKKTYLRFYVLVAFDRDNNYDKDFWVEDIRNTFERIRILMKYKSLPYVMRFKKYKDSPYRGMYVNLSSWTNQPGLFKNLSFREFSRKRGGILKSGKKGAAWRYMSNFEEEYPEIASQYFDMSWSDFN